MQIENISELVRTGLRYERMRLETAASNIANANVALAPLKQTSVPVVGAAGFSSKLQAGTVTPSQLAIHSGSVKQVYDPTHPLADGDGMVSYPDVEPANEMATMISASRAYEADVRAFNFLRSLALKGLEIGAK